MPAPANAEMSQEQPMSAVRFRRRLERRLRWIVLGFVLLTGAWVLTKYGLLNTLPVRPHAYGALVYIALGALLLHGGLKLLARWVVARHAELEDDRARVQTQFHALPCAAWVYDLTTLRILDANPAALEFFDTTRDVFLTQTLHAICPDPEGLERMIDEVRGKGDATCTMGCELRTHAGIRHVEARSNLIALPEGPARLVVAIDRSAEQQALRDSAQATARLQEAQAIARLGSWELDPRTGLGEYSDEIYRIMGRRAPPLRRHRFEELLTASDMATQARIEHLLGDLHSGATTQIDVLLPLIAGDGQPRTVHLCAESVDTPDGRGEIHGTFQDVTEREQSRRLLREREEQFRELVRMLPDGVLILAGDRVMYANSAASGQFGFDGEAILGEPLRSLVADQDYLHVRTLLLEGRHSEAAAARCMRRREGGTFYAGLSVGRIRYGGRDCRLLVVRDLSEPERMRDALAESNAELQAMARRLFSLQEDERRAISRDLHDDIGQAITAMKLSAYAAADEPDAERRREDLMEMVQLADSTVAKLRNLSMLLRPPQLDALGLEAALRWHASMLFRASQVRLELDIQALPERPGNEIEQACFRIAQESLTNALRHACAGEVRLTLRPEPRQLVLEVSDDGDGFDPDGPRGLGLIVMRERAQTAGGTLRIESSPGAGTRVSLHLPYHAAGDVPALDSGH